MKKITGARKTNAAAGLLVLAILAVGCGNNAPKTDAELGLNPQQSAGRRIFDQDCSSCHLAYSSSGMKGPGLKGLFNRQSLPSGLPASDRFVGQTIMAGRGMMPPLGSSLAQDDLNALLAYLHTL